MSTTSAAELRYPKRMKAEVLERFGPPEDMHMADVPVPELGEGEVLIRVETAGVGAVTEPGSLARPSPSSACRRSP
jgi:hypothetical protein